MQNTGHLFNLPGRKKPKLRMLYEHLFGENFAHAHDAMADIEATKDCFVELAKRGEIIVRDGKLSPNTPELPPKGILKNCALPRMRRYNTTSQATSFGFLFCKPYSLPVLAN
jgi:DNA polymerase III epsilon subunit-like protein